MPSGHLCSFCLQGVIEEVREDNVIRSVREDSESSCVGEIAFFMGIAQPRTFQVSWALQQRLNNSHPRPAFLHHPRSWKDTLPCNTFFLLAFYA